MAQPLLEKIGPYACVFSRVMRTVTHTVHRYASASIDQVSNVQKALTLSELDNVRLCWLWKNGYLTGKLHLSNPTPWNWEMVRHAAAGDVRLEWTVRGGFWVKCCMMVEFWTRTYNLNFKNTTVSSTMQRLNLLTCQRCSDWKCLKITALLHYALVSVN